MRGTYITTQALGPYWCLMASSTEGTVVLLHTERALGRTYTEGCPRTKSRGRHLNLWVINKGLRKDHIMSNFCHFYL
jgi:hypothetical protein